MVYLFHVHGYAHEKKLSGRQPQQLSQHPDFQSPSQVDLKNRPHRYIIR
nr:MAG TPA_asm: hypothetical protein [Caudoviricetes sp.]